MGELGNKAFTGRTHTHEYKKSVSARQTGSSNVRAKLTEQEVLEIRDMAKNGKHITDIMITYNISRATAYGIISKRYWKNI